MTTTDHNTEPAIGARSTGLRAGALFGPVVFGVTAGGVALPAASADLGADPTLSVWVLTAHALALGVGTALFGRLADTAGVRAVLAAGSILLALGTVLCLVAPGLGTLVTGRFVLAAGSGAVSAAALATVSATRPDRRAHALAVFGGAMAVFSAGATLLGGAVTELLTWRVALVLPGLSLLAVPLCRRLPSRPGSGGSPDLAGAGLLAVAASSLTVLLQASALGLGTALTASVAALAALGTLGLVLRVRRVPEGFVPRALVTDRAFLTAAAAGGLVYAGLFSAMYTVPRVLVEELGWDVLAVGAWLLPGAAAGALLSRAAGRLAARPGGRILAGATAAAFGLVLALVGVFDSGPVIAVAGASLGFAAFSVAQVVVTGIMSNRLPPQRRAGGLGLLNLVFFVTGGAGTAAVGALSAVLGPAAAMPLIAVAPVCGAIALLLLPAPAGPEPEPADSRSEPARN